MTAESGELSFSFSKAFSVFIKLQEKMKRSHLSSKKKEETGMVKLNLRPLNNNILVSHLQVNNLTY